MYMMYIDDFWNVSNYAIPVKRNSCLNKNSIHLLVACSLESKWTRNSHITTLCTPMVFIHGNALAMLWLFVKKKNIRNDILPKYPFSCNTCFWCATYIVLIVPKFLTIWILMFTYFDTVSLFASMHLQLLSHKLLITETFNRFCFAV